MSANLQEHRAAAAELDPGATGPSLSIAREGPEVAQQEPTRRRAAATFIFFTVTLDMLAVGMIIPVLPRLIGGFTHGDAVKTTQMLGMFCTVFAVMQFLCAPVLGALSDRFGRRPVVLLSNLGLGLDCLLMAWAPGIAWLFVARVVSGLTASSVPTAMAYMTDVTPPEKRAAAFGLVNAAFGIGFVLGPAVGGILGNVNPRLPFWVAGALSVVNAIYGLLILPESLSKQHRCAFSWKRANTVGSLSMLGRRGLIAGLAAVLMIAYITQQALTIYVIYVDYRYHWTDRTVGLSLAAVGVVTGIVSVTLVKRVVARFGERGAILIGLAGGAAGFAMLGMAKNGLLFCLAIPVFCLLALLWPAAQSMIARGIGPSEQGQLQGAINSLRGIAGLIGPGLFAYILSKSIGPEAVTQSQGMPFFVASGFLLASLVVARRVTRS
jgi:DHA1 family tetracycline resistance protein-like MFS transporter